MSKPEIKNTSTRFAVEAAIDASKGDKNAPWRPLKGIATWAEIAAAQRRRNGPER